MKRIVVLGMVAMGCVSLAQAQVKSGEEQFVIYKWYQNGRAHYAKVPPHGVQNYVKLNEHGLVINERPDMESFYVLKPMRPAGGEAEAPAAQGVQQTAQAAEKPAEMTPGTITREQRCETALRDLEVMNTKKTIYEEDSAGNLVPLDSTAIMNRKTQAQQSIDQFCSPQ
ncbi:MAG: hypothetical protein Q4A06_07880 [Cardiobacteriaceae bacterium]|nr:hypothetical protein [Cardiobacteriaceae bacterium]